MGFLNIFQNFNLVGHNLIQYFHLTSTSYFTNLPGVTGDCKNMICKSKFRVVFITANKYYHFEGSLVSDFLQLQIGRFDSYSYAADSYVYKL